MADKLGKAVLEITLDDKQYKFALDQMQKDSRKTADSVRGIGQAANLAVFKELASIGVGAIKLLASGFAELVTQGAKFQGYDAAFTKLSASIGQSKDAMLETTRTATKGLISDLDIMAASNKAMLLGLPVTAQSMGTMAQAAVTLGRAMGQDATKSLDDLTTALGRGSPLILDNLGLTVKVGEANEEYARKLGKAATALTDGEKKLAFYEAAMKAAEEKVATMGEVQLTLADRVLIAKNQWEGFSGALGMAINNSPVLQAGMEAIGNSLTNAFGPDKEKNIAMIVKIVGDVGITIVKLASVAVEGARYITLAWDGLKMAFNAFAFVITTVLAGATDAIATLLETASKIPGVGGVFKGFGESVRDANVQIAAMRDSFAGQAMSAVDGAAKTNAAFDSVQATLSSVEAAMVAAQSATTTAATATSTALQAAADVNGETTARTAEQAKAIADMQRNLQNELSLIGKQGLDRRLIELKIAHDAEVLQIQSLKSIKATELAAMLAQSETAYAAEVAAAKLAGDTIKNDTMALQQEVLLMRKTGLDRELAEIEIKKQRELESIASLKEAYSTEYEERAALIAEKYAIMTGEAQKHFAAERSGATTSGMTYRQEIQKSYQTMLQTLNAMRQANLITQQQFVDAQRQANEEKKKLLDEEKEYSLSSGQALAEGSLAILSALGEKSKAAALASAIISTYQAVAKALSAAPWPANLPLAAGALAAGLAQVNKIRSQKASGFREGTRNLDFQSFGPMSMEALHGDEAVIPRGGGHLLAGEIADAMPGGSNGMSLQVLERIAAGIDTLPAAMTRSFRVGMQMAQ